MTTLKRNLYITYSNQKAREIKKDINFLDKVLTLENLINEFSEHKLQVQIDSTIATSIIYKIIKENDIEYFDYLSSNSNDLHVIHDFLIKCSVNEVEFDDILSGDRLETIKQISEKYNKFKLKKSFLDIADMEILVLKNISESYFEEFEKVLIDKFSFSEINFLKSKTQDKLLEKIKTYKKVALLEQSKLEGKATLFKPNIPSNSNYEEVKTALKIARALMEKGASDKEILITTADIQEYAPIYKLFLSEYGLKGFSSIGTSLSGFSDYSNPKVKVENSIFENKLKSLKEKYKLLGLEFNKNIENKIKSQIKIQDDKVGIELTEISQVLGLKKRFKHIIFIGADMNHFPPKITQNFLYSYKTSIEKFYKNDFYESSKAQYHYLKQICQSLYIINAKFSGKRELLPSIIIDKNIQNTIDISNIKSVNELAYDAKVIKPNENTKEFYESIRSSKFTKFDGIEVEGITCDKLSASAINAYSACPLAYLYENIIGIKIPKSKEEGFDAMQQGSLMHLCFEKFAKSIKDKKSTITDEQSLNELMLEALDLAYKDEQTQKNMIKENIFHQVYYNSLKAGLKNDKEPGLLAKFVKYYIKNAENFEYFKNSKFEERFLLDLDFKPTDDEKNYFIKGFIDRLDVLKKKINIIDYKSKRVLGKHKQTQEKVDILQDVQLALYMLYAKQKFKKINYEAQMLSFKGNEEGKVFANLKEIDEEKVKEHIKTTKENIEKGKFSFNYENEDIYAGQNIKYISHVKLLKDIKNAK